MSSTSAPATRRAGSVTPIFSRKICPKASRTSKITLAMTQARSAVRLRSTCVILAVTDRNTGTAAKGLMVTSSSTNSLRT